MKFIFHMRNLYENAKNVGQPKNIEENKNKYEEPIILD